jgi:hypothetical protein
MDLMMSVPFYVEEINAFQSFKFYKETKSREQKINLTLT